MTLIRRFLHWLGPLDTLSREEQQALGLRGGGRSLEDGEPEGEEIDTADEVAEPIRRPEPGTQIAA
jgi:hypothetical protein